MTSDNGIHVGKPSFFNGNNYDYWKTRIDEDININGTSTRTQVPIAGPINRARAHQLNHQVSSLLSSCPSCLDHRDACILIFLRNQGDDRKGNGFAQAGFGLLNSTNL
jgi:hypothetical protein